MVYTVYVDAQSVAQQLATATEKLLADPQMKHAVLGLRVVRSETGKTVFEKNAQVGLAPASCQKTITSAAAMELLGPQYKYKTVLAYDGKISNGVLTGNLHLVGYGDPTLGSWRYNDTKEAKQLDQWINVLRKNGIRDIDGRLIGHAGNWEKQPLPGGWTWDDIGNYYGAGAQALNWHENQYDLTLRPGNRVGDKAAILRIEPALVAVHFDNGLSTGEKGSGDNVTIYLPPYGHHGFLAGTIPAGADSFTVSGSFPDPAMQLLTAFAARIEASGNSKPVPVAVVSNDEEMGHTILYTTYSPPLDSLNYWFMKKSINLYGECLVKTIAYERTGLGATGKGLELVKQFWKEQGIEPGSLRMLDGSGLSPQNRVTADALVSVLQYARNRPWFHYYYDALPVYNEMKLKSGTIGGVKSFAGYHTAKNGTAYTVAILVNNYEGSTSGIVQKMFRVLDELK
ncbi:MAG: serine-type D-Ala-D-Ala carboxypeptidase [Sediminibacterium sp.]